MADIAVRPTRRLSLGGGFFGEKQISVSGYQPFVPSTGGSMFFSGTAPPQKDLFRSLSDALKTRKERTERTLRLVPSVNMLIMESILLKVSGAAQRDRSGNYSGSISSGITFCFLRSSRCGRLFHFFITRSNAMYASLMPRRDSITRGVFVKESSGMASCRLSARYHGTILSISYRHRFTGARTLQCRVEASARCHLR